MITTKSLMLLAAVVAQTQAQALDLEQAKSIALANNHAIAALRHEVERAGAAQAVAKAAYRPRLGIASGIEGRASEDQDESGGFGYLYGSINLFNGFRDRNERRIKDLRSEQATAQLRAAERAVSLDVEEAFSLYLLKKELIALREQALARNDAHQDFVRRSRAAGSVSDTDLMEFQLVDASLRSELVALRQELDDAAGDLGRILGGTTKGDVVPRGELRHEHLDGSLESYLALVESSSQLVKDGAAELGVAQLEHQVAGGRWLPVIGLEARGGYMPLDDRLRRDRPEAQIALTASLELYSGGATYWEERERAAAVRMREASLKESVNQTLRKVESVYRSLKVIEARADLEKNNVVYAKRYYDSVLAEYRRGFKNSSDLKEASRTLSEVEERRLGFEFDFVRQRLELERVLGAPVARIAAH